MKAFARTLPSIVLFSLAAGCSGGNGGGGGNDAPIPRLDAVSIAEDGSADVDVLANDDDPDGDALTVASFTQGADGAVTLLANGRLHYVPAPDWSGSDTFTYTVEDGRDHSEVGQVEVTVVPVNDDPIPVADVADTLEDVPVEIDVLANDGDGDGDTLQVALAAPGAFGTVTLTNTGTLLYTPDANFSGSDELFYVADDGAGGLAVADVTVTVDSVNDAPAAFAQALITGEDVPVGVTVSGTDPEGTPLTFSLVTGPATGTLTGTLPTLLYQPALNQSGTVSFTFQANDGTLSSAPAQVSIEVVAVNDAPVASDALGSTIAAAAVTVSLPASDVEGSSLVFVLGSAQSGTVVLGSSGDVAIYTPEPGFLGTDGFDFSAQDPGGASGSGRVTVTVLPRPIERVSVGVSGQANQGSSVPELSPDGQAVAFASDANNLTVGDTNGNRDVFLHDRATGATTLVSVRPDGAPATGTSEAPAISGGPMYVVAFRSSATDLLQVPDTNGQSDIFLAGGDPMMFPTELMSVASDGSPALGFNNGPSISADGQLVAFVSYAGNLLPGDTNGVADVFVKTVGGSIERVSIADDESESTGESDSPSISADGNRVAFFSSGFLAPAPASGADIYVRDRTAQTTVLVSVGMGAAAADGSSSTPSISADGRFVTFASSATNLVPGDTNGEQDIFVYDLLTDTMERVSVAIAAQPNGFSASPRISGDGRYVAFWSTASNLVSGDTNSNTDIFVRDRTTGRTTLVSLGRDGRQGSSFSSYATISADGRFIAFLSGSHDLVPDDTNGAGDIFLVPNPLYP